MCDADTITSKEHWLLWFDHSKIKLAVSRARAAHFERWRM